MLKPLQKQAPAKSGTLRAGAQPPQVVIPVSPPGQIQRTYGNLAVTRSVAGSGVSGSAPGGVPGVVQRNGAEKSGHWKWKYGNKVGQEKRSSEKSRKESEELVNAGPEQAVQAIRDSLYSKQSTSEKFQRVTIAIAGHKRADLSGPYAQASGQLLGDDLAKHFGGTGMMLEYIDDMLANDGRPSLRMMLYTALGEVTNSGMISQKLGRAAKLKGVGGVLGLLLKQVSDALGDTKRFDELLRRATPDERRAVVKDADLMGVLKKYNDKLWQRTIAQTDVDYRNEELERQKTTTTGGVATPAKQEDLDALSAQHEVQLVKLLEKSITAYVKFDKKEFMKGLTLWKAKATANDIAWVLKSGSDFQKAVKDADKLLPKIGLLKDNKGFAYYVNSMVMRPRGGVTQDEQLSIVRDQQLTLYLKECLKRAIPLDLMKKLGTNFDVMFDAKKFWEYALEWKAKARPEDVLYVQDPKSEFQKEMAKAKPGKVAMPYVGLNHDAHTFIMSVITTPANKQEDQHVLTVLQAIKRQGEYVGRKDTDSHSNLRVKFNSFLNGKRWPDLISEMGMMTDEQREKVLEDFQDPTNPTDKEATLKNFEDALRKAGMDKEERAQVRAMFTTERGEAGGNYQDLWTLINAGKTTRAKKWVMGVFGKTDLPKAIYKLVVDLDDEEWLQVRQDKKLMEGVKRVTDVPDGKYWPRILDILGMKDETDQLPESGSLRKDAQTALEKSKLNPRRFAYMLDDALKITKVTKKVTSEGEKAKLYVIATEAQNAGEESEKAGKMSAKGFCRAVLDELVNINNNDGAKLEYLQKTVPDVYNALARNQLIPTHKRLERAKHEGFGIGSLKKTDRFKLVESFQHLSGRQLLVEWSNIDDFMSMRNKLKGMEAELVKLTTETSTPLDPNATQQQRNERAEKSTRLTNVQNDVGPVLDAMKRFTIGIKQERRADLKSLGVSAEDRIKIEAMVSDKLIEALEDDLEVQKYLDEIELPYDEYMQQKIKSIDALEMQRHLDTTRQWNLFASKGSQLKETTRNVKGTITSSENKQRTLEKDKTLGEDQRRTQLQEIRDKGGKQSKKDIKDRNTLEARFRDMQKSFKARASALFKLIAAAIVTGLTMGAGAPLSIGIMIAVQAGLQLLETAYNYYVLKENTFEDVAVGFFMGVLEKTVNVLTANMAMALNTSVFHPDMLGPGGAWVDRSISRSIAMLMGSTVMFFPEHVRKQYMQEKELEKVVKEGEDTIADSALDALKSNGKKIGTMFFMEMGKEGFGHVMAGTRGETYDSTEGMRQGDFNTRMMERLQGGRGEETVTLNNGTTVVQDERQEMRDKFEKQKQRQAKKALQKAFLFKPKDANEKQNAKKLLKDLRKDQRGKEDKAKTWKDIKDKLEGNRALAHKASDLTQWDDVMTKLNIDQVDLMNLEDDEMGEVEALIGLKPGTLEDHIIDAIFANVNV